MHTRYRCGFRLTRAGYACHALTLANHLVRGTVVAGDPPSDARHYGDDIEGAMLKAMDYRGKVGA